jgi:hypothetical protein
MIFTDLTYTEIGAIFSTLLIVMFIIVMIARFMLAFKHYIYSGDFGDAERSAFIGMMDGKWGNMIRYAFIGYHPGMVLVDAILIGLFSLLVIFIWVPMIVLTLLLLLGHVMRKRIEVKQTFVGNLKGDQLDEENE